MTYRRQLILSSICIRPKFIDKTTYLKFVVLCEPRTGLLLLLAVTSAISSVCLSMN